MGSVRFHSRTVWSALPVARVCPSGLNATALTRLVWPVRSAGGMFHRRAVWSVLPVARVCPSGLNEVPPVARTPPVWGQ